MDRSVVKFEIGLGRNQPHAHRSYKLEHESKPKLYLSWSTKPGRRRSEQGLTGR